MLTTYTHKKITWIDLESPSAEEVRSVMEKYKLDAMVADELLAPSLKPKVEQYRDYLYLILHFPAFKHTHRGTPNQEIDFIVGKNFVITTHYDTIDPLHKFSKIFEVNSILGRDDMSEHAGFVFYHMMKKLYRALEHELDYIHDELARISDRIFRGEEREMVVEISKVSRELLNFKRATASHKEVLKSFETAGLQFFGESFAFHLHAVIGEHYRIANQIGGNIDMLAELRETNNSLLSTKQNETMKTLTVTAFIVLPLTFVSQLFGMNTDYLPFVGYPGDFWTVIAIMVAITGLLFAYFKYKKWL